MRKFLTSVLPLLLAPVTVLGASTAAHADTVSDCQETSGGTHYCQVYWDLSSGFCGAQVIQDNTTFVQTYYIDSQDTRYQCRFWMERNVNNTGWYDESGQMTLTPGHGFDSKDYWDGPGYQARVCFQFLWSGSSDPGAEHCSPALGNL